MPLKSMPRIGPASSSDAAGTSSAIFCQAYRAHLKADPEGRENFATSQAKHFILREERNFVELVDGTFNIPATPQALP
jgi:hypothetical protein